MNTWAENMKAARKRAGLTREELAERADISPNTLYTWETSNASGRLPTLALLVSVTDVLGITIDEYINGLAENRTVVSVKSNDLTL